MPPALLHLIGALLSLLALYKALRARNKQRLITDTPTSKSSGAFIGLNELKGHTQSDAPLTSHLTETPCVYHRYKIEEQWSRIETETYRDKKGTLRTRTVHKNGWTTIEQEESMQTFYLQDDYGKIRINPTGANIEPQRLLATTCRPSKPLYYEKGPTQSITDSDHIRRFSEYVIPLQDQLYILGHARERKDLIATEIATHKYNPHFLISTRTEQEIIATQSKKFWIITLLGAIPPCATLAYTQHIQNLPITPTLLLTPLTLYATSWLLASAILIFNSLTHLHNRLQQAESLIDIQLQRRRNLIPALSNILQTLTQHNHNLLTQLAALRHQQQNGLHNNQQPLFTPSTPTLKTIRENYPNLKSHKNFLHLQQQLIDTENRIELARRHYNEIAGFWNTRQTILPDRFLMPLLRHSSATLFQTPSNEKKPPTFSLSD